MIIKDQLGRTVDLKDIPQRIVSLVPSQTELLSELGLEQEVVGITKFCIHPDRWFRSKVRVGGTKQLNILKIKELAPDLIIANKEENVRSQIEELAQSFPVWISDVNTLPDALNMIGIVGKIVGRKARAGQLVQDIRISFDSLPQKDISQRPRTCYLIWKDPFMTVGGDTFIHEMLHLAGFQNIYSSRNRYPEITIQQLKKDHCELLMLSSEPYPFRQKHLLELEEQLPGTRIVLVDGEMFSWYGSRLQQSPAYFRQLHQEIAAIS